MTIGIEALGLVGKVASLACMSVRIVRKMHNARALSAENKRQCADLLRQLESLSKYVEGMQRARPEELDALGLVWAGALGQLAVDLTAVRNKLKDLTSQKRNSQASLERVLELIDAGDVRAALQFAKDTIAVAWSRLQALESRQQAEKTAAEVAGLKDLIRVVLKDQSKLRVAIEQVLNLKDKSLSMTNFVSILETVRVPEEGATEALDPPTPGAASHGNAQERTDAPENLPGIAFDYESERQKLEELQPQLVRFWRRLERGKIGRRMSDEERNDLATLTRLLWMPWRLERSDVQRTSDYGVLGSGAFGIVFKGLLKLKTSKVNVAIKIMQGSFAQDEFKSDFFREASMLHRLRHPAIVTFYGAWWPEDMRSRISNGESTSGSESDEVDSDDSDKDEDDVSRDEDTAAFVMERMDGHVGDLVESGKISAGHDLWSLFVDSAEGLSYLHAQGVAHLDVKPENILARTVGGPSESCLLGRAKIADFGVSRQKQTCAASRSARESQRSRSRSRSRYGSKSGAGVVGTLPFMAPEIFLLSDWGRGELTATKDSTEGHRTPVPAESASSGAVLSFACDVYSLGMTICRVMQVSAARAGKLVELPPSFHGGEAELAAAARSGALAVDVQRWVNEVLREEAKLREIVLACVQSRPCDRPPMTAVFAALRGHTSQLQESGKPKIEGTRPGSEMNPTSDFALGVAYRDGKGVEKDMQKAVTLISRSADCGHVEALEALGTLYSHGNGVVRDSARACELYRRAANHGNSEAAKNLGFMYQHGKGVAKNSAQACQLYHGAAASGNLDAYNKLALMYEQGEGVAKDSVKACELYRRAADGGHMRATNNLGRMYEKGEGVAENSAKACKLYRSAAQSGDMSATNNLGRMYENGISVDVNIAMALKLYQRAADAGRLAAVCNLGRMHEEGKGVYPDIEKARELYQRAADGGQVDALYFLGRMYEKGICVAIDIAKARELYQRAVDGGNIDAAYRLGRMYKKGKGCAKDIQLAFEMYQRAADGGHRRAIQNLGLNYEHGDGLAKDSSGKIYANGHGTSHLGLKDAAKP